jgi:hypothetical protein
MWIGMVKRDGSYPNVSAAATTLLTLQGKISPPPKHDHKGVVTRYNYYFYTIYMII